MKSKSWLVFILLLGLSALSAYPDEASRMAKAEEYMRLSKLDEQMRQAMTILVNSVKSNMMQKLAGLKLTREQQSLVDEFQDKLARIATEAYAWETVKPMFSKALADAYTETELDDLIAFYKSPTGQALVAKNPALMEKGAEIGRQRQAAMKPELEKLISDFLAKVKETEKQTQPAKSGDANVDAPQIGSIVRAVPSVAPTPATTSPASGTGERIQVGDIVMEASLLYKVQPEYPPVAKQGRIQGEVRFTALIGKDGSVHDLQTVQGHPLLIPAAMEAVKQWRYKPFLFNGEPVDVITNIIVNFTLSQ